MKRNGATLILIIAAIVILFILLGPLTPKGAGLKGVIDPVGSGPTWVTLGKDRIYISNTASSTIDCLSTITGDYKGRIDNLANVGPTIYSPEAHKLFAAVGTAGGGTLYQIHPETYHFEQEINIIMECRGMAVTPIGKEVISIWGGWKEGPGMIVKNRIDGTDTGGLFGTTRESPTSIVLSRDGRKAYVSSHYGQRNLAAWLGNVEGEYEMFSTVEVFDLTSNESVEMIKEIRVGLKPQSMALFGDGRYIMVASAGMENVTYGLPDLTVIDTRTDEVVREIRTPGYFPFMVVASDELGKAFTTYLVKVEIAQEEDPVAEEEEPEDPGTIEIEVEGGTGESGGSENSIVDLVDDTPVYTGMYGRGFLAIDLETFEVDIYEDPSGLPFASLCILDDSRIIATSPIANRLVVLEAEGVEGGA